MCQSEHLKHPLRLNDEASCPLHSFSGSDGEGTTLPKVNAKPFCPLSAMLSSLLQKQS